MAAGKTGACIDDRNKPYHPVVLPLVPVNVLLLSPILRLPVTVKYLKLCRYPLKNPTALGLATLLPLLNRPRVKSTKKLLPRKMCVPIFGETTMLCRLIRVCEEFRVLAEVLISSIGPPANGRSRQESYLTTSPKEEGIERLALG